MSPNMQIRLTRSTRQDGVALLILLVIIVLGTTGLLLNSLNRATITTERDRITAEALAQAKEALIGRAMSDDNRPGSLPCPDTTNDGVADSCSTNVIGRLPWKTLGLPDLRDSGNERLWYALSDNFRDQASSIINSDTQGQLTITGNNPAGNVIAVVFSPGVTIGSQQRDAANPAAAVNNAAANFLEGENANGDMTYITAAATDTFNDRLLTISANDLFPPVEKAVAKRLKEEWLLPSLNTYSSSWGAFPFAALFADPTTSNFVGTVGVNSGLLPTGVSVIPTWAGVPTVSFSGGSGSASCLLTNGNSRWQCDLSGISGTPTIYMTRTLNDAGRSFWWLHGLSDRNQVRVTYNGNGVAATDPTISPVMNATITATLNAAGAATIVFTGSVSSQITRIELRDMQADVPPAWFTDNNWQRVMVYAISPGYAPGGGNACAPSTTCLTVNGSGGGNDKRAIIVMAGPARSGQTRPNATLNNYFEGQNETTDFIYENQTRSDSFNDHVLVIAP